MHKEKIIETISEINTLTNFNTLSASEKLIICSNLILMSISSELPLDLQKYSDSLLNNGKELVLKSNEYKNNAALQVALKAHLIVDLAGKL